MYGETAGFIIYHVSMSAAHPSVVVQNTYGNNNISHMISTWLTHAPPVRVSVTWSQHGWHYQSHHLNMADTCFTSEYISHMISPYGWYMGYQWQYQLHGINMADTCFTYIHVNQMAWFIYICMFVCFYFLYSGRYVIHFPMKFNPAPRGLSTTFHPILIKGTCITIYGKPLFV